MPHSYAPQFRAKIVDQVRAGRRVAEVAASVDIPQATVFRWVRQDRIDRGELAGSSTAETAELKASRRRINELEAELATVKRASELFAEGQKEGRVVRPKDRCHIVEMLAEEGHGTKRVCRILGVPPSSFFRWRNPPVNPRAIRRAWLTDVICQIHLQSRQTYGRRRVQAELLDEYGQIVNKKLVRSIMTEQGLYGLPTRRRGKPNLAHRATTEDMVNRNFHRDGPNQLWMTDITEHATREGKVYCCCVLDAWSRRVVGWSLDRRPTAAMVNSALSMAIDARRPDQCTTVHSDHGSQFTSWTFSQRIRSAGLAHSLGTIGDAFDNAVVESFWGRMQTELLNRKKWKTRMELSTEIFDWIEVFYNRTRRHSSLDMMSPIAYEKLHSEHTSAA
jgi:putative transposase